VGVYRSLLEKRGGSDVKALILTVVLPTITSSIHFERRRRAKWTMNSVDA
jgi:hypothetical protein